MTGSNWQNFETEVAEAFGREVAQFRTALNPRLATVRRKPGYYSRDRDGNIVFDVAVEVCEPGATEPSLRWVIECKDFPRRKVTVDDVEEFIQKLDQVGIGNIRGSMVTRVGYQEAAFRLANSRRIGLYTLNKELLRVTAYSSRPSVPRHMIVSCTGGCLPSGDLITPSSELNLFRLIRHELHDAGLLPAPVEGRRSGPPRSVNAAGSNDEPRDADVDHALNAGSVGGDSGSVWYDQAGRVMGMVIAGEPGTGRTFACSPVHIANILRVSFTPPPGWRGSPLEQFSISLRPTPEQLQQRWPVLVGGVSIGHGLVDAGTLGCFVWDADTGEPLALTCAHVAAPPGAKVGDPIYQPGPGDIRKWMNRSPGPEDIAGELVRWQAVSMTEPNLIDAAVFRPLRPFIHRPLHLLGVSH